MRTSLKKGIGYGLTSGVITTLGLIVGLEASTGSIKVVTGSILIIAIADALSDAFGIHISEEAEGKNTQKEIWEATIATFIAKFVFAMTFIVPLLIFTMDMAVMISIGWGLFLISAFSLRIAHDQKESPLHIVTEHLVIALIVILVTHYVGIFIHNVF